MNVEAMSNGALVFAYGDVWRRIGKLEEKQFFASLAGYSLPVPPELYAERDELGGELFKRLMS